MTNSRVQDDMVDKDYHVLRNPARLSTVAGKAFRHMGTEAKFNFLAQKMIKNLGGTQTRPSMHHCLDHCFWKIAFSRISQLYATPIRAVLHARHACCMRSDACPTGGCGGGVSWWVAGGG